MQTKKPRLIRGGRHGSRLKRMRPFLDLNSSSIWNGSVAAKIMFPRDDLMARTEAKQAV